MGAPSEVQHEQIATLLGAYALGALDADEAASVTDHLRHCHRCHHEVERYRAIVARFDKPKQHD